MGFGVEDVAPQVLELAAFEQRRVEEAQLKHHLLVPGFIFFRFDFRLRVSGFGLRVSGEGFRVYGFGFRFSCFVFRVSAVWFLDPGFGFRDEDFGFRDAGVGWYLCGLALRSNWPSVNLLYVCARSLPESNKLILVWRLDNNKSRGSLWHAG